jgi:hypothetical protein
MTLASQSIVTTLWGGRGPILHVALSPSLWKEDGQYNPPNLILALTDVAGRLNPASFVDVPLYPICHGAEALGYSCERGFGQEAVSPKRVD